MNSSKSEGWERKRFCGGLPRGAPVIVNTCFSAVQTKQRNGRKHMKWTNGAISMYHRAKKNVFLESVSFLDDMEV